MILWALTKPWNKGWQFVAFLISTLFIPGYVTLASNDFEMLKVRFLLQMTLVAMAAFFVLNNLRKGVKMSSFFTMKTRGNDAKASSKVDTMMLLAFYSLCAVYVLLYGPVS